MALAVARRRPNTTQDGNGNNGCTLSLIVHASSHAIRALENEPLRNFSNCPRLSAASGRTNAMRPSRIALYRFPNRPKTIVRAPKCHRVLAKLDPHGDRVG